MRVFASSKSSFSVFQSTGIQIFVQNQFDVLIKGRLLLHTEKNILLELNFFFYLKLLYSTKNKVEYLIKLFLPKDLVAQNAQ